MVQTPYTQELQRLETTLHQQLTDTGLSLGTVQALMERHIQLTTIFTTYARELQAVYEEHVADVHLEACQPGAPAELAKEEDV